MRKAILALVAVMCVSGVACAKDETTVAVDRAPTGGGEGKPVGPSRVAAPLEEAGPLAFTPGASNRRVVRQNQLGLDGERHRDDPMMSDEPDVEVTEEHVPPVAVREDSVPEDVDPALRGERGETCRAQLSEVRVEVLDVYDGAAITLTASRGQEGAIQSGARRMVGLETGPGEAVAKPGDQPTVRGTIGEGVPVSLEVVDVERGARISYFALDPDDVIPVRNAVRQIAAQMERGVCPPRAPSGGEATEAP